MWKAFRRLNKTQIKLILTFALAVGVLIGSGLARKAEMGAIRFYQNHGRPTAAKVSHCRFEGGCSQYALDQLESRGFFGGNMRIAGRTLLCSPLGWALDEIGVDTGSKHAHKAKAHQDQTLQENTRGQ